MIEQWRRGWQRDQQQQSSGDMLDTALLEFAPHGDIWTIRDACEGVQIFGAIGSGKTSGSGATLARAYLRAGFGGMVMCSKPEEAGLWQRYAEETGRQDDVVVIRFRGSSGWQDWRFNFLDYEQRRTSQGGGLTQNIVSLLQIITDIVEGDQEGRSGDPYWQRAMNEIIRNSVDLLRLSQQPLTMEHMMQLIRQAPHSAEMARDAAWQERSYLWQCLVKAEALSPGFDETDRHDIQMVADYWMEQFATLADRTRSSIVSTFTSMADLLLHGDMWRMFCTHTNLVPDVTFREGLILVLDMPVQQYHEAGRIAQLIFKQMFQFAVIGRDVMQFPRPVFLWADEAQNFVAKYDFQYQAVARSARACTVYLTQNISNYDVMLGGSGQQKSHALLGNFSTKIWHANGDQPTNQYAAEVISQTWQNAHSFGYNSGAGQPASSSGGGSEVVQYKVLPEAFTRLKQGGPLNNREVEAIIFKTGRQWKSTGDTYAKVKFIQGTL